MRQILKSSAFKRLLAASLESAELGVPKSALPLESQVSSAQRKYAARSYHQSRALLSAATENSGAQAPPYVAYGAVGAAGVGILAYFLARQPADSSVSPVLLKAEAPKPPEDQHEVGKFDVLDHLGMHFTQDDLLGNFAVIYFGEIDHPGRKQRLLQMADAVLESDRKSNMHYLIPVFATRNPAKDDVIKMNAMVEDYATSLNRKSILNVRLKGITGDDNSKLHAAAQQYTTTVKGKIGVSSPSDATKDDEGDLYFVNPEGQFIASYGPDASPKDIAEEWSTMMKVNVHPYLVEKELKSKQMLK